MTVTIPEDPQYHVQTTVSRILRLHEKCRIRHRRIHTAESAVVFFLLFFSWGGGGQNRYPFTLCQKRWLDWMRVPLVYDSRLDPRSDFASKIFDQILKRLFSRKKTLTNLHMYFLRKTENS